MSKQQTLEELIRLLPHGSKTKFRANLRHEAIACGTRSVLKRLDLNQGLVFSAFAWIYTPEGVEYWVKVAEQFTENYHKRNQHDIK